LPSASPSQRSRSSKGKPECRHALKLLRQKGYKVKRVVWVEPDRILGETEDGERVTYLVFAMNTKGRTFVSDLPGWQL
jgi:hypothetical protein